MNVDGQVNYERKGCDDDLDETETMEGKRLVKIETDIFAADLVFICACKMSKGLFRE